jgi:DNA-binding winged helix-turn-helix (wHTH) protein/tetratricopeptide (TPR) repeat protein
MTLETQSPVILRFGVFEVDVRAGELRKRGIRIKLQDQPFHVLTVLLQQSGEVVTREELRSKIWPSDTFVEFDNSLNKVINKLREALGDSADSPRFIETLPRRGYRFIAQVTAVDRRPSPVVNRRAAAIPWWKILAAATLVLAGVIGGVLFRRSRHTAALADNETIVLADFANNTGDPVFDDTLKQGLRVELEQSPFLNILSDEQVSEDLQMMGHQPDEKVSVTLAREACQRAGGAAVLVGSISSLGTHYIVGVNALNCHTGASLGSQQVEAENREGVIKSLGGAATRMRNKLGESLATIQKYNAPLEQATTTSLEALQAYSLALSVYGVKGERPAIPFFQRAVDIDPNFAMAEARLGALYSLQNRALAVRYITRAYQLREKVTLRERLYIEAHYFRDVTGQAEKAALVWQVMQQLYPRQDEPDTNLAGYYAGQGNYEKALQEQQQAVRLFPDDQDDLSGLAWFYICLNRLVEAEDVLKQAEKRDLNTEQLFYDRYLLAFLKGDTPEMERLVAASANKEPQAWAEAYHGRLRRARELLRPPKQSCGSPCEALSQFEAYFGALQQARLDADAAMKATNEDEYVSVLHLALAVAMAGNTTRAETLCDNVEKEHPVSTVVQRWLPMIHAAEALALKNPDRAVELLHETSSYELGAKVVLVPTYERGQAYLMQHSGSAAASEFQKIIDHPGIVGVSPIGALARLGLARAFMLQGDTAKALDEYRDFLTLWKDADRDIPVFIAAKSEYARASRVRYK